VEDIVTTCGTVLLVDDNEDELSGLKNEVIDCGARSCVLLHPNDIEEEDLKNADLVVVDYTLENWQERDNQFQISLKPENGIALAGVLQQHSRRLKSASPTGYALITGNPANLKQVVASRRTHVISRLSDLEWVFTKSEPNNARQITSLSAAIKSLPQDIKNDLAPPSKLIQFLGAGEDNRLCERYSDAVQRCRPPVHSLADRSHGLSAIRWLLHRILPHTTFLTDQFDLAMRLRMKPGSLESAIKEEAHIAQELQTFRFSGQLNDFLGPRWWRDGIEQWLWEKTNQESSSTEAIHDLLRSLGIADLDLLYLDFPVATLDDGFHRENEPSEFDDVVKIQLDDWPDYAEPPYVRKG